MAYLNNIPIGSDSPGGTSRAQMLENFSQLDIQFAIDHTAFSVGGANQGEHKKVSLSDVQADPGLVFPKCSIYTKHFGAAPNRYTNLYFEADPENAVVSTQYVLNAVKAWVKFNGTTGALIDQYNVSGVVRNSAGNYTISFVTALQNANYVVNATTGMSADGLNGGIPGPILGSATTTSCGLFVRRLNVFKGVDIAEVFVSFIGN